ncbi:unnamed protein product [Cyclocybe aegerita]|uniref:Alpha-ketoglutarate-dependent dioxygenase AlkB-like domain-containing protein n=1 Tax=Cyclocybe aegerita TaxID=1973307 RepID=A0A8S0XPN1_CYCAE|nr:unnamed protein product [Cyclocybe aegerita]
MAVTFLSFHSVVSRAVRRSNLMKKCQTTTYRKFSSDAQIREDFYWWPTYFSRDEQRALLSASLFKLDGMENRRMRKKREAYWASLGVPNSEIIKHFAPDEMYDFAEASSLNLQGAFVQSSVVPLKGHFDGVIHHYREMHLSSWPVERYPELQRILDRLYSLCPTQDVQTHILHLASYGDILPHVDNLDASGSWILGVSLGDERLLRLESSNRSAEDFCLSLPSGSVYLQRLVPQFHAIGLTAKA